MRTRCTEYSLPLDVLTSRRRGPCGKVEEGTRPSKMLRTEMPSAVSSPVDALPEDVLLSVLSLVAQDAKSPADIINLMRSCKRFRAATAHPLVLGQVSTAGLAVKARSWSEGAHRFLAGCAAASNLEAAYLLGMIRFYCLGQRGNGAQLLAKAAMAGYAGALHSLAVIQFNGSGGNRRDKDLRAGVALCARAASLGHVDAMRELGHCLQDGYGVTFNVNEGRRLLLEANAREAAAAMALASGKVEAQSEDKKGGIVDRLMVGAAALASVNAVPPPMEGHRAIEGVVPQVTVEGGGQSQEGGLERHPVYRLLQGGVGCSLLSDFGCNVPPAVAHPANQFLVDWFAEKGPPAPELRLCSHSQCGRCETRRHEFRRCGACGCVNYCSRACQALDWKLRHKHDCMPVADWEDQEAAEDQNDGDAPQAPPQAEAGVEE